jgi:mannose/fructose/N-acetylgalactosamine-specific phosphotransferase system component IIC
MAAHLTAVFWMACIYGLWKQKQLNNMLKWMPMSLSKGLTMGTLKMVCVAARQRFAGCSQGGKFSFKLR